MILNIKNLKKAFGNKILFKDCKLSIHKNNKIALIGQNGTGKSTLIKCISGEEDFEGTIDTNNTKISIMEQEREFEKSEGTFTEYLQEKHDKIEKLKIKYEEMLGDPNIYEDYKKFERIDNEFQILLARQTEKIEEVNIRKTLKSLKFEMEDYDKKIKNLSGGQRTKLRLAECLAKNVDFYIFDEPTNHIDFETLKWLEDHLERNIATFIVVSHDRYFLKKLVNRVIEIENLNIKDYKCTYAEYIARREHHLLNTEHKFKTVTKEKKRLMASAKEKRQWAQVHGSKQLKNFADALERRAEELPEVFNPKEFIKDFKLKFEPGLNTGKRIFAVKDLKKSFGDLNLFDNVEFTVNREDKVAIIGGNGTGKTTLLKILAEIIKPNKGEISEGINLKVGYFDQEFSDINMNQRVMEFLTNHFAHMRDHVIIATAIKFGFPRDKLRDKMKTLSGGEKARINLVRLMEQNCNVLLLDEPTNNLDLELRTMLENALKNYKGTVIFVSHDRYFINKVATKTLVIENKSIEEHDGGYLNYRG
ncbi:ABC-F family ATP-binding cassette domain-containing protein [archaeon]|jgi:ATP-binding cassette, subfamily F, member 3|nr:ABC-F family ATP-binding cassette domain-containing protein [archaeon]MBT4396711.1 ABC-F family ATP-binding cassette domain-containing protein [archaeon]MBT4441321.1 ABC-F family ATP-binding cassette domain-containing protein [archaeon]